ncbi:diaminopimelate epimerase [Synechococcus sp. PCC 7336]|uniref:diaminopimelate epimerase n=1 Tax=Synechococcus sp. PCC 7336 TaxID=195250 RepID=UPI00034C7AB6|nr:diaminopimelate epimerase [Synechococcus sp. PCC 7336]
MAQLPFVKYHGLGNDFILLDNRDRAEPLLTPEQAMQWCDRRFGIGADGVIFALPGTAGADFSMRIYNSDGSEPQMCGNGIRCMAQFLQDLGEPVREGAYQIHTLAGRIVPQFVEGNLIRVDMGAPVLAAAQIPTTLAAGESQVVDVPLTVADRTWQVTAVSMGNPHCIAFVEDVAAIPLAQLGPQFEHHPAFPERVNTEFVQVLGRDRLRMRVWERGAGITLACGTGACATLIAAVLLGKSDDRAIVELPGGNLEIRWDRDGDRIHMTGPAQRVYTGIREL